MRPLKAVCGLDFRLEIDSRPILAPDTTVMPLDDGSDPSKISIVADAVQTFSTLKFDFVSAPMFPPFPPISLIRVLFASGTAR